MALRRKKRPREGPSLREEVWNLPNILTYDRIVLIPFVMYYLYQCAPGDDPESHADYASRFNSFIAALLFCIAAGTDFLDGWVARNFNMGSTVGAFLDPLADKLLVMACLVMMVYLQRVPAWFVVLLLTRELSITSLRSIATQEGLEIAVDQAGKWKTAFQLSGLIGVMLHYTYPTSWVFYEMDFHYGRMGFALLCVSMAFSIWSAGLYFYRFAVAAAEFDHQEKK